MTKFLIVRYGEIALKGRNRSYFENKLFHNIKRAIKGMDKVIVTIPDHGNTSAASIPLALGQGLEDGRIKRGDLLCLASLGGGISWGASVLRF